MTNIKTAPFDSANYLKDSEDVAAYLEVYLEDSTPEELSGALATIARSRGGSDFEGGEDMISRK